MKKCRVCKIDLNEDYGVYENSDNQRRYYCFKHWKTYYGEKTMGSKISIQDIDQKASDFAKANFMKQLKEHYQNLEKENKELKEKNQILWRNNTELKEENKKLKDEREEIFIMCQKLDKEIQRLVDEINEPKELDDK